MHIYTCEYIYMYIHIYVYTYIYIYSYINMYIRIPTQRDLTPSHTRGLSFLK